MSGYTRRKIDQSFERRFVVGLIVSDRFMREARTMYKPTFLSAQPVVTISEWCFKYYEQYEKAPQRHIQDLFDAEEAKLDDALLDFIESLLMQLSDEWEHAEKFNVDFLLDETEKYFKGKSLLSLSAGIRDAVNTGNLLEAESLQVQYNVVQRQKGGGVEPFTDEALIGRAISETEQEPLFRLPGALGERLNPQFYRTAFVAFEGPEKVGKSFWIDEIAIRAFRCRCNVALFDAGDMSYEQRVARLHTHLAMKPLRKHHRSGRPIRVPVPDCLSNQENTCASADRLSRVGVMDADGGLLTVEEAIRIGYTPCFKCNGNGNRPTFFYELRDIDPITTGEAIENGKRFFDRARGRHFKLSCHENSSLNVKSIHNQLEVWKHTEGFVPDVIAVDYPGIMAPEDGRKEHRNQVNDTWKALRGLAQRWSACVVTVDQTDADSYGKESISRKNFSEDKRKHGHVTAMYALNQTDKERQEGIMRIGELFIREGETNMTRQVRVLECRAIGRVNLGSYV